MAVNMKLVFAYCSLNLFNLTQPIPILGSYKIFEFFENSKVTGFWIQANKTISYRLHPTFENYFQEQYFVIL